MKSLILVLATVFASVGFGQQLSYDEAHRQAVDSQTPLVVVFSADWCIHCKSQWNEMTTTDPLSKQCEAILVYVDIEKDVDLAKRFRGVQVKKTSRGDTIFPETGLLPTTYVFYPRENNTWLKRDIFVGRVPSMRVAEVITKRLLGEETGQTHSGKTCRYVNGKWVCE